MTDSLGRVVLVGAGPGDPELLTRRAHRVLTEADVVVHDRLVSAEILALVPATALVVPVGKHKGGGCAQEDINEELLHHARRGAVVVRLKGGDPFVFGRGAEERDFLTAHGVDVDVVPGITSALAAPTSAGVAVTQRGVANACTIISGHVLADYDWEALARVPGTLVVLMGATTASPLAAALLDAGRAPDEPVLVVHAATTPQERSSVITLQALADHGCPLASPATIVIGAVVGACADPNLPAASTDRSRRVSRWPRSLIPSSRRSMRSSGAAPG